MKKTFIIIASISALVFVYFVMVPAFNGTLSIAPTLTFGPLTLRWYGLILAGAVLIGYFVAKRHAWRFGISPNEVDNFSFWLVLVCFLGARLYFVAFAYEYFLEHPDEIYKIWHGGLSIYGSLIAGVLFTVAYSWRKAYSARQLLDLLAISLPLAQAFGRLGNFLNQEAYGLPTNLPWKMYVAPDNRLQAFMRESYYHPTFLYEALLMIAVFFILRRLIGRLKPGVMAFGYLTLYSLIRFFIEPLRLDSVWIGNFRADQIVALVVVIISGLFILRWQFAGQTENQEKGLK